MNQIELLHFQTKDAYQWVNKLVNAIPLEQWDNTPEVLETNMSWQVGHLIMSFYFHSVMVIVGHKKEVMATLPMREYSELYSYGKAKDSKGKVPPSQLQEHLNFMQGISLGVLPGLSESQLQEALEPTKVPHPIAKTKLEALDWNIKHTMWHCGQIGTLKRLLGTGYEFGLQRPS